MSLLSALLKSGDTVSAVGDSLDALFTSDEERLEYQYELLKAQREFDYRVSQLIASQNNAQASVNRSEAGSSHLFVAGWRPAIGWVGTIALAYQFIVYPLLLWIYPDSAPPHMEADILYAMMTGMLGLAGMRSIDKFKRTDTKKITGL